MEWKNNPVIAIAISAASTAAFCINIITPIYEKKNINRIQELEEKTAELEKQKKTDNESKNKSIIDLQRSESSLKEQLEESKRRILFLQQTDQFAADTPLPKGFREVRPLDPTQKIFEIFKNKNIETFKGWYSEDIEDTLFSSITYYRLNYEKKEYVSHILIHFRSLPIYDSNNKLRTADEEKQHEKNLRMALSKTFHEKYGPSTLDEDDNEVFVVDEIWNLVLKDSRILIIPTYSPISILQAITKEESNKKD